MALYEIIINVQESPPTDDDSGSEWVHLVNMKTRDRAIAAATLRAAADNIDPLKKGFRLRGMELPSD
jgi:hypothetical protein